MVALGNFDGVHLGHQKVIAPVLPPDLPQLQSPVTVPELGTPRMIQGYSDRCTLLIDSCHAQNSQPPAPQIHNPPLPTVVTFYPHPQEFFSGAPRPWLTPLGEKAAVLQSLGIAQLVLLPFNPELAALAPQTFVEQILLRHLQARHISVGQDFRFGHQRAGTTALLQSLALAQGVKVTCVALAQSGGDRISSSRIRQALWTGDLTTARQLLGRPYSITGRVVRGQELGRQLGFPTANLQITPDKALPRTGVYGVWVYGIPGHSLHHPQPGVMNLGVRPTVDGQHQTLEVHVLQWQGDLYGQTLTVTLETFLRPEQRFDSLAQLKAQIEADCQTAVATLQGKTRPQVRA